VFCLRVWSLIGIVLSLIGIVHKLAFFLTVNRTCSFVPTYIKGLLFVFSFQLFNFTDILFHTECLFLVFQSLCINWQTFVAGVFVPECCSRTASFPRANVHVLSRESCVKYWGS